MCCPFTLFKKQTKKGPVWYARFWDERAGKYTHKRSTGVIAEGRKEVEHKAREMLLLIRFEATAADRPLVEYIEWFWRDDSPYIRECATVRKKPLSAYYVRQNAVNVLRYVKTFPAFEGTALRELAAGLIRDWMAWMASQRAGSYPATG